MKRICGSCSLCCKLVPVGCLNKPAGERCKHQRHTGCRVYTTPDMPAACKLWSCAWLAGSTVLGGDASALHHRPDRCHYVVDMLPDYCVIPETNQRFPVLQVWVDPDHPDAHREPSLRAFLAKAGERGIAALIRYDGARGFVLVPPAMNGGEWYEGEHKSSAEGQHDMNDVIACLNDLQRHARESADA